MVDSLWMNEGLCLSNKGEWVSMPIYMKGADYTCIWCGSCMIPSTVCRWICLPSKYACSSLVGIEWPYSRTLESIEFFVFECAIKYRFHTWAEDSNDGYCHASGRLSAWWISRMAPYLGTWVPFLYTVITVGNDRYAYIPMPVRNLLQPLIQPASGGLPNGRGRK